jgi:hypothetical protein
MRIFFDTEFIENGPKHVIIPVSIGIVRDDGDTYYAEFADVDWSLANDWVIANVKPYIGHRGEAKSKTQIANEIKLFVGERPEFWAYFADYDWVLLCQLYGRMIDLPETWPMHCLDIKQYMWHLGVSKDDMSVPGEFSEHDALSDAQWNMAAFNILLEYHRSRTG